MVKEKLIIIMTISLLISGCGSALPGMENLDTHNLYVQKTPQIVKAEPVVIPINDTLLMTHPPAPYIYYIGSQDVLSIHVWQHPEFNPPIQIVATTGTQSSQSSGQAGYLVNRDGKIYFPLVGYVTVGSKTIDQVRLELSRRLTKYIRDPQVMIRVADFRSKKIYIMGEVMKPGLLPLNDQPMTITDALTLSGSFDPNAADTTHVYIIRGSYTHPVIYWLKARTPDTLLLAENFQLQPNDIVYVSSAVMTRWNRFLNQLLPTLQTVWYTKTITNT